MLAPNRNYESAALWLSYQASPLDAWYSLGRERLTAGSDAGSCAARAGSFFVHSDSSMVLCWRGSPGPLPSGWGRAETPLASLAAAWAARPAGRPQEWLVAGQQEGRRCALPCRLAVERHAADALARVADTAVRPRAAAGRVAVADTGGCSIAGPGRRRYTPWPGRRSGGSGTGVAPDGDDSEAEQPCNRPGPLGIPRS